MSEDTPASTERGRQFTVGYDDDGIRLDRWFKRHLPDTSFNLVSRWARTGQLRVDGARATPGDRLQAGQVLRVPPPEVIKEAVKAARIKPERPPLSEDQAAFAREMVIHRDAQALVLNKPPGLATQGGTKTTEHVDGLLDALQYDAERRPKLVHRLDKDTSGALLIARTSRAAAFFSKAFSSRTAKKVYWALVVDVPSIDDGMIELPIGKQPGTGGEKMHVDEAEGQAARTRYRVIERAGNRAAWVELQPFTGRTHQLRVHMAAIGHPIVGDGKYGGPAAFLTGGVSRKMHLHARRLRIDHPDGGNIDIQAELPSHFAESLKMLGFEPLSGDNMPLDEALPPTREKKAKARAHAKTVRKERRGERRGRRDTTVDKSGPGARTTGLMHPDRNFRKQADWLDFADRRGFAHIFAATASGPMVVHAPVSRFSEELWFHVSRANRATMHLPGASVIVSVAGADGYVSPNWYLEPGNQVPTWNYQAVEVDGVLRQLSDEETTAQLDALAARHEPRVNPANPWARHKMDPGVFAKMLRAITGFAIEITAVRETVKLSQNKHEQDRVAVIAGLRASGGDALAAAMAAP